MVLGVMRCAMTAMYKLTTVDLIPGEMDPGYFKLVRRVGADTREEAEGNSSAGGGIVVQIDKMVTYNEILDTLPNFKGDDKIFYALRLCGIACLSTQGWSILETGHQYISDIGNHSYKVPLFRTTAPQGIWCQVNLTVKHRLATSMEVRRSLITAGCGGVAVRLPFTHGALRRAKAYIACLNAVHDVFVQHGGGYAKPKKKLAEAVAHVEATITFEHGEPADWIPKSTYSKTSEALSWLPGWLIFATLRLTRLPWRMASTVHVWTRLRGCME
ncbi:hypothetical protein ZOSMA_91G00410 [Zostera marina]|uniref:Uncharacterized protein n=1 Tax=Zostera marina TaxID=29655 RepID=A0A0K9NLD3_ZOSMR|nr:hypothetical protein ZOSMA_91G00410 [Zostera marina]